MRESVTYQAILDEGREEGREEGRIDEVKRMIIRLGQKWLGAPGENATATLAALTDLERLELLLERLKDVRSWDELLALP